MDNAQIEALEMRLAYQDDALNQLSDTVYAQSREIERLAERCRQLEIRLQSLTEDGGEMPASVDETPPHY